MLRHLERSHSSLKRARLVQERIISKNPKSKRAELSQYLVKEKELPAEAAKWLNADDVLFELLYGYEVLHCRDFEREQATSVNGTGEEAAQEEGTDEQMAFWGGDTDQPMADIGAGISDLGPYWNSRG